jgi:hypothetical protein
VNIKHSTSGDDSYREQSAVLNLTGFSNRATDIKLQNMIFLRKLIQDRGGSTWDTNLIKMRAENRAFLRQLVREGGGPTWDISSIMPKVIEKSLSVSFSIQSNFFEYTLRFRDVGTMYLKIAL